MFDNFDPTKDSDFQLAMEGSLSISLAPDLLDYRRDYIEHMESMLDMAAAGNITSIELSDIDELMFRAYLRESFLISTIAHLEDLYKGVCDDLTVILPTNIKMGDLGNRSSFDRGRVFFRKVVMEEIPSDSLWNRLLQYREVRNGIAHRGHLWIDKSDKKKWEKVKSLPGVEVDEYDALTLGKDFCPHLLEFATEFIEELTIVCKQTAGRVKRFRGNK